MEIINPLAMLDKPKNAKTSFHYHPNFAETAT